MCFLICIFYDRNPWSLVLVNTHNFETNLVFAFSLMEKMPIIQLHNIKFVLANFTKNFVIKTITKNMLLNYIFWQQMCNIGINQIV